jgi:hypothetical protein
MESGGSARACVAESSLEAEQEASALPLADAIGPTSNRTYWNISAHGTSRNGEDGHVVFERLFRLRRPRLKLRVFHCCFLENALSLSVVVFALWKKEASVFAGICAGKEVGVKALALTLSELALGLIILVHSAAIVRPIYALTRASAM